MELRGASTPAELAAFIVFAAIALLGAIATVSMRNPIRCAVGLFFHIIALAGLYLDLSAQFLGVIQLLVYAGAVVVLFVFVIMLLGPAADTPRDARGSVWRLSGVLLIAAIGIIVAQVLWMVKMPMATRPPEYGTLERVGSELFTGAAVPFELIGITLVAAVVGAFSVARGTHRKREIIVQGGVGAEKGVEPPHGAISGTRSSEGHP